MAGLIAGVVSVFTMIAVVAAVYQVESHPTATATITSSGQNVIDTTLQQLFKW